MSAQLRTFLPGDKLFNEGDPSTSLFVIKSGSVAIRKRKGQEQIELARLHSNEVLGELSFFDRLPRSATAIAVSNVEVIEIEFSSLEQIYRNVPPYFQAIMAAVSSRLRRANDMIRRLKTVTNEADSLIKELESETGSGGTAIADLENLLAGATPLEPDGKTSGRVPHLDPEKKKKTG